MWLTAYPGAPMPTEHETEAAAEAHATQIVRSGTAKTAVAYEHVLPDERQQP